MKNLNLNFKYPDDSTPKEKAELTFKKVKLGLNELERFKKYKPIASAAIAIINLFS
jgi:hypothetical protein